MDIKQISECIETWETKTIEFLNGASYKLTISTLYKGNLRRCFKSLVWISPYDDSEELVAESYINEIDLIGREFGNFNPEDYISRELFKLGHLEKADFRDYESKEN